MNLDSRNSLEQKPLGRKSYGSIGHLPGSRLGPADHSVHEGQARICYTGNDQRGRKSRVIVQTKLDGSCVAAALLDDGVLVSLGRAGYLARSSRYVMHHLWADYVDAHADRFRAVLRPGERVVGEWLAQAHGTIYDLRSRVPFVAFDVMAGDKRLPYDQFVERIDGNLTTPDAICEPMEPEEAMACLDPYGAAGGHEGVVYRVENPAKARVDFLAKFVRADKVDGLYLAGDAVWNWPLNRVTA